MTNIMLLRFIEAVSECWWSLKPAASQANRQQLSYVVISTEGRLLTLASVIVGPQLDSKPVHRQQRGRSHEPSLKHVGDGLCPACEVRQALPAPDPAIDAATQSRLASGSAAA